MPVFSPLFDFFQSIDFAPGVRPPPKPQGPVSPFPPKPLPWEKMSLVVNKDTLQKELGKYLHQWAWFETPPAVVDRKFMEGNPSKDQITAYDPYGKNWAGFQEGMNSQRQGGTTGELWDVYKKDFWLNTPMNVTPGPGVPTSITQPTTVNLPPFHRFNTRPQLPDSSDIRPGKYPPITPIPPAGQPSGDPLAHDEIFFDLLKNEQAQLPSPTDSASQPPYAPAGNLGDLENTMSAVQYRLNEWEDARYDFSGSHTVQDIEKKARELASAPDLSNADREKIVHRAYDRMNEVESQRLGRDMTNAEAGSLPDIRDLLSERPMPPVIRPDDELRKEVERRLRHDLGRQPNPFEIQGEMEWIQAENQRTRENRAARERIKAELRAELGREPSFDEVMDRLLEERATEGGGTGRMEPGQGEPPRGRGTPLPPDLRDPRNRLPNPNLLLRPLPGFDSDIADYPPFDPPEPPKPPKRTLSGFEVGRQPGGVLGAPINRFAGQGFGPVGPIPTAGDTRADRQYLDSQAGGSMPPIVHDEVARRQQFFDALGDSSNFYFNPEGMLQHKPLDELFGLNEADRRQFAPMGIDQSQLKTPPILSVIPDEPTILPFPQQEQLLPPAHGDQVIGPIKIGAEETGVMPEPGTRESLLDRFKRLVRESEGKRYTGHIDPNDPQSIGAARKRRLTSLNKAQLDRFIKEVKASGKSYSEIGRLAGKGHSLISDIIRGENSISIENANLVLRKLGKEEFHVPGNEILSQQDALREHLRNLGLSSAEIARQSRFSGVVMFMSGERQISQESFNKLAEFAKRSGFEVPMHLPFSSAPKRKLGTAPTISDADAIFLKKAIAESGMTRGRLAELSGVSENSLGSFVSNRNADRLGIPRDQYIAKIPREQYNKIAAVLGVPQLAMDATINPLSSIVDQARQALESGILPITELSRRTGVSRSALRLAAGGGRLTEGLAKKILDAYRTQHNINDIIQADKAADFRGNLSDIFGVDIEESAKRGTGEMLRRPEEGPVNFYDIADPNRTRLNAEALLDWDKEKALGVQLPDPGPGVERTGSLRNRFLQQAPEFFDDPDLMPIYPEGYKGPKYAPRKYGPRSDETIGGSSAHRTSQSERMSARAGDSSNLSLSERVSQSGHSYRTIEDAAGLPRNALGRMLRGEYVLSPERTQVVSDALDKLGIDNSKEVRQQRAAALRQRLRDGNYNLSRIAERTGINIHSIYNTASGVNSSTGGPYVPTFERINEIESFLDEFGDEPELTAKRSSPRLTAPKGTGQPVDQPVPPEYDLVKRYRPMNPDQLAGHIMELRKSGQPVPPEAFIDLHDKLRAKSDPRAVNVFGLADDEQVARMVEIYRNRQAEIPSELVTRMVGHTGGSKAGGAEGLAQRIAGEKPGLFPDRGTVGAQRSPAFSPDQPSGLHGTGAILKRPGIKGRAFGTALDVSQPIPDLTSPYTYGTYGAQKGLQKWAPKAMPFVSKAAAPLAIFDILGMKGHDNLSPAMAEIAERAERDRMEAPENRKRQQDYIDRMTKAVWRRPDSRYQQAIGTLKKQYPNQVLHDIARKYPELLHDAAMEILPRRFILSGGDLKEYEREVQSIVDSTRESYRAKPIVDEMGRPLIQVPEDADIAVKEITKKYPVNWRRVLTAMGETPVGDRIVDGRTELERSGLNKDLMKLIIDYAMLKKDAADRPDAVLVRGKSMPDPKIIENMEAIKRKIAEWEAYRFEAIQKFKRGREKLDKPDYRDAPNAPQQRGELDRAIDRLENTTRKSLRQRFLESASA